MAKKADGEAELHFRFFCMVSTTEMLLQYHYIIYKNYLYLFGSMLLIFMA